MTVLTGKQINVHRLVTLLSMLKLESLGMKRHGPSALSIVKSEFGLRGSKESVLQQFESIVKDAKKELSA